jgi:hypothetical protein
MNTDEKARRELHEFPRIGWSGNTTFGRRARSAAPYQLHGGSAKGVGQAEPAPIMKTAEGWNPAGAVG